MSSKGYSTPKAFQQNLDNTKVEYVRLGNTGLRVSVPIFGAMSFGDPKWADWVVDEEKALPLLKAAYDRGLNTWDTANVYSNGVSEKVIAAALKKYEIPRHKVVILTKCFFGVSEDPDMRMYLEAGKMTKSSDYVNQFGLSRQAIMSQVEGSLARLGTDYIDLLQIHRFDTNTPIEETMLALHDLVRSGKVRYIGASSMWGTQFAQMQFVAEKNGWTKFVSMQNQYNLLYREEEREMIRFCNSTGVGLIPWSPLCRGYLARPPKKDEGEAQKTLRQSSEMDGATGTSEVDKKIIERVDEIAKKKGWKMSTVALAWINKRVSSPIIGFSSVARIDEALEARGLRLTEEEEKYLEELYVPQNVNGHV